MAVSFPRPKSLLPTTHSTPRPLLADPGKAISPVLFAGHWTPTRPCRMRVCSTVHRLRRPTGPGQTEDGAERFVSSKATKSRKNHSVAHLPSPNPLISVSFTRLDIAGPLGNLKTPFGSERRRSKSTAKLPPPAPVLAKCGEAQKRRFCRISRPKLQAKMMFAGLEDSFGPW